MRDDRTASSAELLTNVSVGRATRLPPAIQMLEALPDESRLGLIAENEVAIAHQPVLADVPCLANLEVAAELRRWVRPKWIVAVESNSSLAFPKCESTLAG